MTTFSRVKQDEWKRTQIRLPHPNYDALLHYASEKNISLNTAMIELIDKGLNASVDINLVGNNLILNNQMVEKIAEKVADMVSENIAESVVEKFTERLFNRLKES